MADDMKAITFLMGTDGGGNAFFANAAGYLKRSSDIVASPATGQTLEGVFDELRARAKRTPPKIYETINIVTHATGFSSVEFGLRRPPAADYLTEPMLAKEIAKIDEKKADAWKQLGAPIVVATTKVVFYGCDIGRGEPFIRNFGRLFAEALHVYAPLRVALFRHVDAVFEYRLARTWSVPWNSDIEKTATAAWPATRTKFLAAALTKFGPKWTFVRNDPLGEIGLEHELTPIMASATATQRASWFFSEKMWMTVSNHQNAATEIAGMPVQRSAIIAGGSDVDDTTVENVMGPAQITVELGPTRWVGYIAVLAQVIETPVDITNTSQYRHTTITPAMTPSPGPTPPGGSPPAAPPSHASAWDAARDALVAGGMGEGDFDMLVSGLRPVDAEAFTLAEPAGDTAPGGSLSPEDFL